MKILVLSDSHASLYFMRLAIKHIKPDHVVHLGDHFDDGRAIAEENPHIRFHQVPGNCDRYRTLDWQPEFLCYDIDGIRFFMTHGHKQRVKTNLYGLLAEAHKYQAKAALYGHTHRADCYREEDGLWVINPGSCGSSGGSVALIETANQEISACRILTQTEILEIAE